MDEPRPARGCSTVSRMTSEQSAPRAQHTEVSTAYLRQLDQERESAMRAASHPGSAFDGAPPALHDLLEARVALGADEMVALHARPRRASGGRLRGAPLRTRDRRSPRRPRHRGAAGRAPAWRPRSGRRSAARARRGGAPTLAILSEYDALPGVGHGCGHNVIAVMGLGAFLALAALAESDRRPCRDAWCSSGPPPRRAIPARSTWPARAPSRDLDAVVMAHPYGYDLADQTWLGRGPSPSSSTGTPPTPPPSRTWAATPWTRRT